ncbi:hypothetical protein ABE137_04660 [Brevibacillus laterosporus]|uniref:hypothetical protein n=1 Tax=Brevibacillus laterosporus TaxID=1465 RepID=UPI003D1AE673
MNVTNINLFQMKTKPSNQEKAPEFLVGGYVKCKNWVVENPRCEKYDKRRNSI